MDAVHKTLRDFAKHYSDYIPEIPVLDHVPSAIEFLSDYLILNKPFVISCPENHLPAIARWRHSFYLQNTAQNNLITACVTPDYKPYISGYPILHGRYMVPEVRKIDFYDFLCEQKFKDSDIDYYYVDKENNLEEFPQIADDIRTDVPWATEALGSGPIGARISIGHRQIITSMHKDQYDNFFYVLRGWKEFKLIPPIAHPCIAYKKYKKIQYVFNGEKNKWEELDLNEEIEVIPSEIEPETLQKKGFFRNIKSYVVKIHPGESLYVPALWYHGYHQSDDCYTLNYWYDLKWDLKFPLLTFLNKLFKVKSMVKDASVDIQTELGKSLHDDIFDETLRKLLD